MQVAGVDELKSAIQQTMIRVQQQQRKLLESNRAAESRITVLKEGKSSAESQVKQLVASHQQEAAGRQSAAAQMKVNCSTGCLSRQWELHVSAPSFRCKLLLTDALCFADVAFSPTAFI